MRRTCSFWLILAMMAFGATADTGLAERVDGYIEAWKRFYPSQAVARGFLDSIERFEDRAPAAVADWITLNRSALVVLEKLESTTELGLDDGLDLRLLRTQILQELDHWENDQPHERSPAAVTRLLAGGLEPLLQSPLLSASAKRRRVVERLDRMAQLAGAARATLRDGRPGEIRASIGELRETAESIPRQLTAFESESGATIAGLADRGRGTAHALLELAAWLESELLPRATLPDQPILGRDTYAAKLTIYTDSDLTPERLAEMAHDEIRAAQEALAGMARAYWLASYPDQPVAEDPRLVIARAFDDLESNRPEAELPYLHQLRRYGDEVEAFVRDHEIATVLEHNTLSIELAPESAGPMARIGFVRSAPPFHPNPWTTWYLATIPDSHPETERIDFWRSFNYSFKRFIVIHELFPGHYMQLKILRENPRPVRVLFPYRPFIEGWATFTERIVLDAGYAEGDWLTRLAQLRKRLENANRAYMSVQAHCNGWSEEQVFAFSVETSLLAPQFAKSLWGRLMRSPMQILTYMLMGLELRDLYEAEQSRLGERFVLREFMDTILRTGPAPSAELAAALRAAKPDSAD